MDVVRYCSTNHGSFIENKKNVGAVNMGNKRHINNKMWEFVVEMMFEIWVFIMVP